MTNQKPLPEQITASNEDVQALLKDNRSLSVAILWRRMRDLEAEMRERFRALEANTRIASLEEAAKTLNERLNLAGVKYKELREDLDTLKIQK